MQISHEEFPEALVDQNPYCSIPMLKERDLVIYEPSVLMEYLEERYPSVHLLPQFPAGKAEIRLLIYRVNRDWGAWAEILLSPIVLAAKKQQVLAKFKDSLIALAPIFKAYPFFMSENLSMTDCYVWPLLYRLEKMGIQLPTKACADLLDYRRRLGGLAAFKTATQVVCGD
jgi:RNA polymerase-associated protein